MSITYTDFNSYSLPLLAIDHDVSFGGGVGPGNPFYVVSTPGAIKDDIVLYTGASGTQVNENYLGMDDAYPTPSGTTVDQFHTTVSADPGGSGEFLGDAAITWDTTLSSLTNYLDGSDLIFFFNHNELNSAEDQDLAGWGKVSIVDADGLIPAAPIEFFFRNTLADPWALTIGELDINWAALGLSDYGVVNHNLGANQAAYAINSLGLDSFLGSWDNSSSYDTMQVEFHLKDLSNGYEQLFIQRSDSVVNNPVPEPGTMILLGMGMIGLAGVFRKTKG